MLIALLVGALGLLLVGGAQASEPVALDVRPASVETCQGRTTHAQVVARNATDATLTGARLSWTHDGSATIASEPGDEGALDLGPGSEAVWLLSLRQDGVTPVAGPVHLRLDYAAAGVPRVAVASLDVASPGPVALAERVQLELHTTLRHLDDGGTGVIHVVVRNTSSAPARVDEVLARAPSFVEVQDDGTWPVVLAAGDAHTVTYVLRGADRVQPGKHVVLFEARVETSAGGCPLVGRLVAAHELEAGVYGESVILTVLGIPSILLLPGFLMLLTASSLWRLGLRPRGKADAFPLAAKDALFWAAAITLSLVAAAVWTIVGQDLREGYGLATIQWLWGLSVCVGAAVHMLVLGGVEARERRRERLRWSTSDGDPIALLRKLRKRRMGPVLPYATSSRGGEVVVLEQDAEGAWVCAPIELTWTDDTAERTRLRKAIEVLRKDPRGSTRALARRLEEARAKDVVRRSLAWKRSVERVSLSELTLSQTPMPIVRELFE